MGGRSAGLDVALGVDSHAQRLGVFSLNFPEAEGVCGQLAVPNSVFTEDMLRAKLPKGDFHVHFSPPCQELSVARGAKDADGARSAQAVIQWCVDFAMSCGALSWSLEEVNSAEVYEALESMQRLDEHGHLNFLIRDVDCQNLGVPQSRRRYIAGSPWLLRHLAEQERTPTFLSVAAAFAASTRKDAGGNPLKVRGTHLRGHNPSQTAVGYKRADRGLRSVYDAAFTLTCHLSSYWAKKEYRNADGEFTGVYQGTPSSFKLTPFSHEDALVVQGFPDNFMIGPSRVVARDGIGNAVPPPVMQRMLSFYGLKERAVEEPVAKRRRA